MAQANGSHDCSKFVPPSSLKELLDFYDKLQVTNGVKEKVLEELKNRLTGGDKKNGWVRDDIDFSLENANNGNGSGSMSEAIKGLKELREKILNGNGKNTNPYTLPSNAATDPCIKKYADAIIQNAFPLFGCLFYLWFMCDNGQLKSSGGQIKNGFTGWETEKINNGNGSGNNLHNFLTDKQPADSELKHRMLPRGYKNENELNQSKQGSELFNTGTGKDKNLFSLNCSGCTGDNRGNFQQALFFLLFLAPRWCHAMSGHALLFLDWFSKNASSVFSGVQWLHVKGAGTYFNKNCEGNGLEQAIQKLAEGETNGPNIAPVHRVSISKNGNTSNRNDACNMYWPESKGKAGHNGKSILHNTSSFKDNDKKAHVFMQYVSWLWWCLPQLTESLRAMSTDSKNWNNKGESFKNSTSFGPFAFGFTFTDNTWTTGNGTGASQLNGKISSLITAIEHFRDYHIGAFFWAIRRPFACGSLAAWIVAFTFLLYVNFMPLDLFHIQSHYNVFSFSKSPIRPLHEVSYFSRV